jgi:short-subunit dehydrogenase
MRANGHEVVVVTGASAGVGRAVVREFAKSQARIGLIARGKDGLEAAKREVEAAGGEALVLQVDVADADAVEHAAAAVEQAFGPIDIWINNAMLSVFSPAHLMTPAEYKRVTEVTYLGYVYGTLTALRRMRTRDRGVIVQVGSALAYRSIPLQSAYCAAKHAIMGFTESLFSELLHDKSNVRLCIVQLPAVNTPQFSWVLSRLPNEPQPVPPIYQPEVIADAIVWAARHERRELYIGFSTIKAIAAERVAPRLADRYLAHMGYSSQQTTEPVQPNRKNNLWAPLPGDHGAHGEFDARARRRSAELWLSKHRGLIACGLLATGALVSVSMARRRSVLRWPW